MKTFLLLLAITAFASARPASAQSSSKRLAPQHDEQTQKILDAQIAGQTPTAKTTAQKLRLTGFSYRLIGGPALDSGTLHYSGARGSDSLKNATWDEYYYERTAPAFWGRRMALADSTVTWAGSGSGLQLQNTTLHQYDVQGNILSAERRYASGASCYKYTNTYDASGAQQTRVMWQQSGACGQYAPVSWATYNAAGNILEDSSAGGKTRYYYSTGGTVLDSSRLTALNSTTFQGWKYYRVLYTYDAAGLMSSYEAKYTDSLQAVSQTQMAVMYSYDAQGRLDSAVQWNGPMAAAPAAAWKYGYTGSFRRPTSIRLYALVAGNLRLASRSGYHLNSTGNWDTAYFYRVVNGMDTLAERDPIIYNTEGFIDYVSGYYYNASTGAYSPTPYDRNQFYYESYDDGTRIVGAEAAARAVIAYPVPFTTMLNVDVAKGEPWVCLDAQGRTVAQGTGASRLDTERWTPGLYVLRALGSTAKLVKQ